VEHSDVCVNPNTPGLYPSISDPEFLGIVRKVQVGTTPSIGAKQRKRFRPELAAPTDMSCL